jgi:hypothetical protein
VRTDAVWGAERLAPSEPRVVALAVPETLWRRKRDTRKYRNHFEAAQPSVAPGLSRPAGKDAPGAQSG